MDLIARDLSAGDMAALLTQVRLHWQKPELLKRRELSGDLLHTLLHAYVERCAGMYGQLGVHPRADAAGVES